MTKQNSNNFLAELLEHYVSHHGLGGMAKSDFDALVVYLYIKYKNYDPRTTVEYSRNSKQLIMRIDTFLKIIYVIHIGLLKSKSDKALEGISCF